MMSHFVIITGIRYGKVIISYGVNNQKHGMLELYELF
jgi:hypothetical protein